MLRNSDVQATPSAFENVLLQHLCPPVHGPNAPARIGSIGERYASHNLSPPSAFLVRATLDIQGRPSTPFYIVLGLPTVALSAETLSKPLWTDSAANAATAPFQTEPGTPFLGTTAHSASIFAKTNKFPALEAWWSDPTTWWSMSGTAAFQLAMTSSAKIPADLDQHHPALAHLWAANCTDLQIKLVAAGATIDHEFLPDPGDPALILPAMLPLPPHHGLPVGQIFAPEITLADLKRALSAMGFSTIPSWLDHPVVAAWLAHYARPAAVPAPIPFTTGAALAPRLPSAMFRSTIDVLQDAALIFANKMRHACVRVVYPKSTKSLWESYLRKAHPGTFETSLPKIHALPPADNPFLFIVRPSATGTWAARYGYHDWHTNEAHYPPSFRDYLKCIHCIRASNDKDPPNLPLLTWDEEVAAKEARDDARATPLNTPDGIGNDRLPKKARFSAPPTSSPGTQPAGITPGSRQGAFDLTKDTPHGTPMAPQALFGTPATGSFQLTPASQWSTSPTVLQASVADTKRQPYQTWTFNTANRSFPEQGCYHLLSGLTATRDRTFIGSLPDGTPVSADLFLFPGNVNLRFRRDFLAQLDPSQASTWLRGQYTEDHRQSSQPDLCPEIQPSFFSRENIDLLRREFICGHELTPDDLQQGSTILLWCRSLAPFQGYLFPHSGPTLQDAKTLLSNIQMFLDLSVTEFSAPAVAPGSWQPPHESPFHRSLLHEALRDLNTYFLGRHLPLDWNATPSSRRCYFWIFASLLHQLFALFDRWRKQDDLATPLIPMQHPGQRIAGLSTAIYDRHSHTSTSLLHEVQLWRKEAQDVFSGRQFSTHFRLQQEPPPAFFDGPQFSLPPPTYASFAAYPPAPPTLHPARHPPPPSPYHHQQQAPLPPPPLGPSPRSTPRHNTAPPVLPPAPIVSAGKSLLTYAASATAEHRSIATAVDFMNAIGGRAPVLATRGIGPYKSDRQLCMAYCFQAAPFTGCRGNPRNRPCHRIHLDCTSPDALPAPAVAPLVAWLRSDRVRQLLVPTPAFLETNWWRQNPP